MASSSCVFSQTVFYEKWMNYDQNSHSTVLVNQFEVHVMHTSLVFVGENKKFHID